MATKAATKKADQDAKNAEDPTYGVEGQDADQLLRRVHFGKAVPADALPELREAGYIKGRATAPKITREGVAHLVDVGSLHATHLADFDAAATGDSGADDDEDDEQPTGSVETLVLAGNVDDVLGRVNASEDREALVKVLEAEQQAEKPRKTLIAGIEKRIAALEPAEDDESDPQAQQQQLSEQQAADQQQRANTNADGTEVNVSTERSVSGESTAAATGKTG